MHATVRYEGKKEAIRYCKLSKMCLPEDMPSTTGTFISR